MFDNKVNNEIEDSGQLQDKYYGVGGFILEIVKVFLLAFIIIVPIRVFLFQPFFVQGLSMEPNFENSEYLIINEFGYKKTVASLSDNRLFTVNSFKKPVRQDVIVFRYPRDPNKFFIKRVIALPGEKIQINESKIRIFNNENPDGFLLDESAYLAATVKTKGELTLTLKENEYFVMGDNREFSSDSRTWGALPSDDIIGKVLLRAWPPYRFTIF